VGRLAVALSAAALAGAALTTIARAGAPPTKGWTELLVLAAEPTGAVSSASAFGDPAQGVFLLTQEVALPDREHSEELAALVLQALEKKGFHGSVDTPQSASFQVRDTSGRLRVRASGGKAIVTTCFYNERSPEESRAICETLLGKGESK